MQCLAEEKTKLSCVASLEPHDQSKNTYSSRTTFRLRSFTLNVRSLQHTLSFLHVQHEKPMLVQPPRPLQNPRYPLTVKRLFFSNQPCKKSLFFLERWRYKICVTISDLLSKSFHSRSSHIINGFKPILVTPYPNPFFAIQNHYY